jgi:serine/threonine-protein kinase
VSALELLQRRLGERYRIERELGRGGMGAVYLARDLRLDRPVALKVLPSEYAVLPTLRERFLRETRTAAGFSHPNIVPVYAVEEADDVLAYAMGYIEGESLAERVARTGPLGAREMVKLLQDVAYALAYAHGRGVVHRDIKPENIMIERATGRALVMDFGIARPISGGAAAAAGLTRVGEVVGTPEYMSPEQASGDQVDGRSDLYSLGLVAHYALTGRTAMSGETVGKVLARQIAEPVPPMRELRPDLPEALGEAIGRCLAKDPAERFERAEGLVEALDAAQLTRPEIPVPIRLLAQELGTLSLIVVFVGLIGLVFAQLSARRGLGNLDALLPLVMLVGVLITRFLQTLSEARRLAIAGFSPPEVHAGLLAVVDERAARREELRGDERTRRARRRTVIVAIPQLLLALAMIRAALEFRTPAGPQHYRVTLPGTVLVLSGMALLGVSLVLLLRSPFRMPPGERLFRLVWLGPLGRAFLRFAGRGVRRSSGTGATPRRSAPVVTPAGPCVNGADARFRSLEARVAELERLHRERA